MLLGDYASDVKKMKELYFKKLSGKKAEIGPIGAVILFGMFILNWFIWLGSWLSYVGRQAVINNNLDGVEAFAFSNLNFIVLVALILGMLGFMYLGSRA